MLRWLFPPAYNFNGKTKCEWQIVASRSCNGTYGKLSCRNLFDAKAATPNKPRWTTSITRRSDNVRGSQKRNRKRIILTSLRTYRGKRCRHFFCPTLRDSARPFSVMPITAVSLAYNIISGLGYRMPCIS